MMVWSDMVDVNLGEVGERLSLAAAANEEEVDEAAKSGRVKLQASSRRGAMRAMITGIGRTWVMWKKLELILRRIGIEDEEGKRRTSRVTNVGRIRPL